MNMGAEAGVNHSQAQAKPQTEQSSSSNQKSEEKTQRASSRDLLNRARALRQRDQMAQQAKQILKKKEGDVDEKTNLEEVLNATEREYSLVKRGEFDAVYSFSYSFFSDDRLDIGFDEEELQFTRFAVERDAQHSMSHVVGIDYGLRDNINIGFSLPFLSKYEELEEQGLTAAGDLSVRVRWQPSRIRVGELSNTWFAGITLPTGRSPYEIDADDELSSGSGFYSVSMGSNFSKVIDPVVAFSSVSFSYGFPVDGLDQIRGNRILQEVEPGGSLSFSLGLVYALSYDVSLTLQYQQTYSAKSEFVFSDVQQSSIGQNSALFNIGTSWRVRRDTIFSLGVGIGQTRESPDILISSTIPISFSGVVNKLSGYLPTTQTEN